MFLKYCESHYSHLIKVNDNFATEEHVSLLLFQIMVFGNYSKPMGNRGNYTTIFSEHHILKLIQNTRRTEEFGK